MCPVANTWARGQGRAGAVRLEPAGEADALGMVAAMAECRAAGRREGVDQRCGVRRSGESQPAV